MVAICVDLKDEREGAVQGRREVRQRERHVQRSCGGRTLGLFKNSKGASVAEAEMGLGRGTWARYRGRKGE